MAKVTRFLGYTVRPAPWNTHRALSCANPAFGGLTFSASPANQRDVMDGSAKILKENMPV
jgi:hypothetical protein